MQRQSASSSRVRETRQPEACAAPFVNAASVSRIHRQASRRTLSVRLAACQEVLDFYESWVDILPARHTNTYRTLMMGTFRLLIAFNIHYVL